jgi:hypothetical protein
VIRNVKLVIACVESYGNKPAIVEDFVLGAARTRAALKLLPVVDSNAWTLTLSRAHGNGVVHHEASTEIDCDDAALSALLTAALDGLRVVACEISEVPF